MCDKCSNPPVEMDLKTLDALRQMHGFELRIHRHSFDVDKEIKTLPAWGFSTKKCCGRQMLLRKRWVSWKCRFCEKRGDEAYARNSGSGPFDWATYRLCMACGTFEPRMPTLVQLGLLVGSQLGFWAAVWIWLL